MALFSNYDELVVKQWVWSWAIIQLWNVMETYNNSKGVIIIIVPEQGVVIFVICTINQLAPWPQMGVLSVGLENCHRGNASKRDNFSLFTWGVQMCQTFCFPPWLCECHRQFSYICLIIDSQNLSSMMMHKLDKGPFIIYLGCPNASNFLLPPPPPLCECHLNTYNL